MKNWQSCKLLGHTTIATPWGLLWCGPTDVTDLAYRLAMQLAAYLNTVLILPEELRRVHDSANA